MSTSCEHAWPTTWKWQKEEGVWDRVCLHCLARQTFNTLSGPVDADLLAAETRWRCYKRMATNIALFVERPHPLKYDRAGGDCVCDKCGLKYFDHPNGSEDFLTLLCNGTQVKL